MNLWSRLVLFLVLPPVLLSSCTGPGAFLQCDEDEDCGADSWGNDATNMTAATGQISDAPSGTFSTVEAGHFHSCAVDTSGAIACWGSDDGTTYDYGQVSNAP